MSEEKINKTLKDLNDVLQKPKKENNIFKKMVLIEKCRNGREMSERFLNRTKMFYTDIHSKFDRVETLMEEDIISVLQTVNISASKKSCKRSLPYTNVIESCLMLESDVSKMFDYTRMYRKIVKELLIKDVWKIRFYVHVESYEDNSSRMAEIFSGCGVRYCFRYFIH